MILPGSFDLHIIDSCNLHCTGCIVLDYLESGKVTNQKYNLDDVKEVMSNFERLDLRVEELKILHTDSGNVEKMRKTRTIKEVDSIQKKDFLYRQK